MPEFLCALVLAWIGIVSCLSQSAVFSGLNLAFFSVGRLRQGAVAGNKAKRKVLRLRSDANFLLCKIRWGSVSAKRAPAKVEP